MGGGSICYSTALACVQGPNNCGQAHPCSLNPSFCGTGLAAVEGSWACDLQVPSGAKPNGAGQARGALDDILTPVRLTGAAPVHPRLQFCYSSAEDCALGPNACLSYAAPNTNCSLQRSICATGAAGSATDAVYSWFCQIDMPHGAVPTGSGALCYTSKDACDSGPNACDPIHNTCTINYSRCGTGVAASNIAAIWFCSRDTPVGAVPIGSGQARPRHPFRRVGSVSKINGHAD